MFLLFASLASGKYHTHKINKNTDYKCFEILTDGNLSSKIAQVSKICGPPPEYPYTRLAEKYTQRPRFNIGEKVYFNCDEDFTPSRGSRAVQCVGGKWTKLTLKCESKYLTYLLAVQFSNHLAGKRTVKPCFSGGKL